MYSRILGFLIEEASAEREKIKKLEKVGYCYRVEKVSAIMYKNTINWKTSRDRNS